MSITVINVITGIVSYSDAPSKNIYVPQVVSRRQARRALLNAGLLNYVDGAINSIEDEFIKQSMRIDWQDATEFRRDDKTLIKLSGILGLSSEQLDDLFIEASKL